MDAVFALLYLALPLLAWWRTRSLGWVVLWVAGGIAVMGSAISGLIDLGVGFDRLSLQIMLGVTLLLVLVVSWARPAGRRASLPRQFIAILVPVGVLLGLLLLVIFVWADGNALMRPVGFLIGHDTAEDNSRWLDFTAQWAGGSTIEQPVPMGGPLQLYLTFIGSFIGVLSVLITGGFNEVFVAGNSVIFGEYLLVASTPFAFAVMAETRLRAPSSASRSTSGLVPAPLIWTGALVLALGSLAVMAFGHLTFQFGMLVMAFWVATFLVPAKIPRARLLSSIAAIGCMTVWLPLGAVAFVLVVAWLAVFARRWLRHGARSVDWLGVGLLFVAALGILQPAYSALRYLIFDSAAASLIGTRGLGASAPIPHLADSILFAARGGTEQAGPILILLALVSAIAASIVVSRQMSVTRAYIAFAPLALLATVSLSIYVLDAWGTGSTPNYGSLKFGFLVALVALATCLPIGALLLDPSQVDRMTMSRWCAAGGVVVALTIDSLLPRAITQIRPELWSPPIPFNNTSGSYWYPAEVRDIPEQPVADNPIACVYLPEGYPAPTAIVPSGLSSGQRVYACTRQLAGLAGLDAQAQPVVSWLLREWTTNTPAWSDVYDSLSGLPPELLDRQIIVLDDGSNVKGVETLRSLLSLYPKDVATG